MSSSSSGDGDEHSSGDDDKVISIHISSAILASKSTFFRDLFQKQSGDEEVSLEMIHACERAAFINPAWFMYGKTPPKKTMTTRHLTDLLIVSQKFQVSSCVKYCCESMRKSINWESVPFYFCLPNSVPALEGVEEVQRLMNECKEYVVMNLKPAKSTPFNDDRVYSLPLKGIEALLSADELEVWSEDYVYEFLLIWACLHYPKLEERQQFLRCRLHTLLADDQRCRFRDYVLHPVRVVRFDSPTEGCAVYLDLRKEQFTRLDLKSPDEHRRYILTQFFWFRRVIYQLKILYIKGLHQLKISTLMETDGSNTKEMEKISFAMALRKREAQHCVLLSDSGPGCLKMIIYTTTKSILSQIGFVESSRAALNMRLRYYAPTLEFPRGDLLKEAVLVMKLMETLHKRRSLEARRSVGYECSNEVTAIYFDNNLAMSKAPRNAQHIINSPKLCHQRAVGL
ncbi:hypothetical protein Tsubulata_014783 [Turnera subulata]|uniref:BTB domain-containing protein n=1 Tax=Turnera subulata TaxID=218843 RepID=A0A9Q0FCM4_9ROSI|nr:hypothetical protein Tsubulata_014783 [Turnera subulata]